MGKAIEYEKIKLQDGNPALEQITGDHSEELDYEKEKERYSRLLIDIEKAYAGYLSALRKELGTEKDAIRRLTETRRKDLEKSLGSSHVDAGLRRQIEDDLASLKKQGVDRLVSYLSERLDNVGERLGRKGDFSEISIDDVKGPCLRRFLKDSVTDSTYHKILHRHLETHQKLLVSYDVNKEDHISRYLHQRTILDPDRFDAGADAGVTLGYMLTLGTGILWSYLGQKIYHTINYGFKRRALGKEHKKELEAFRSSTVYALMHAEEDQDD